jgi:ankyrin repeat protein
VCLLIEHGADVNSQDRAGWTLLDYASLSGRIDVERLFMDHGAEVNVKKQDHRTSIRLSAANGNLEIVKLFLERAQTHNVWTRTVELHSD